MTTLELLVAHVLMGSIIAAVLYALFAVAWVIA